MGFEHGTAQHGTSQHITAHHSTPQHNTTYSIAQHNTAQHSPYGRPREVATDAACKAMYAHDCEVAVAVGVNLLVNFEVFISFRAAGMLSWKGRCATFSDDADGYLREEGCGAVLLKPLSSALGV